MAILPNCFSCQVSSIKLLSWGLSMELCCSLPETPSGWMVKQGIYSCENIFLVRLFIFCINSLARCCVTTLLYVWFSHFMVSASSVSAAALSESGCREALLGKRSLMNGKTLQKQQREDSPSPLGLSVYPTAVPSQFVGLKSFGNNILKAFFCTRSILNVFSILKL